MQDFKSDLLNNIKMDLLSSFDATDITLILTSVANNLENYTLTKEQNSLIPTDDYNNNLLKEYTVKKSMSGISKNSITQYLRETKKCLTFINKKANEINCLDIENYLVMYKYTYNVSNTTLSNMRTYLNNFFSFLYIEEIIDRNPVDKVSKVKRDTIKETPITRVEEEKLFNVCTNSRDRALLEVLFSTGCRVSEVSNMKISDIDFQSRTINVLGKGNKFRTVFISDKAVYYLTKYFKSRKDDSDFVFVGLKNPHRQLSKDAIEIIVKNIGIKANVENVHPHRCRATYATRLIDAGMGTHQVQKLMGHEDINTTMIYYRGNYNLSSDYHKLASNL